jgi:diguanylate cyclase (GGDEF)-like protein
LEKTVKARTHELELAKQQAEKEAQTDFLTGVPNRRCFLQDAERLLNQCRAKRGDLCLLMFDLDNFKIINDRYGHQASDRALQLFANAMS